jgi:hypothetical protein
MSKTMAEVLAEHGEWRYTNGAGSAIVCRKCGAPVENVVEHQADALSAAGFGFGGRRQSRSAGGSGVRPSASTFWPLRNQHYSAPDPRSEPAEPVMSRSVRQPDYRKPGTGAKEPQCVKPKKHS